MGLNYNHVLGRDQKFFASLESTAGTQDKPTVDDDLFVLSSAMTPEIARRDRVDSYRGHRDITSRITGKAKYTWEINAYLMAASAATGTLPLHVFLEALIGGGAAGGANYVYSQSSVQAIDTLTLTRNFGNIYQESMWGCCVDQATFSISGGEDVKVKFSGMGMDAAFTGSGSTGEALSGGETDVDLASGHGSRFDVGSIVSVGVDTDKQITAITGDNITVDSALTAQASGVAVVPYVPTFSVSPVGTPISGINGAVTWDSFDPGGILTAAEISYANNIKANEEAAFQQNISDYIPGMRSITGSLSFMLRSDLIPYLLARKNFATKALSIAPTDGTRTLTFTLGYCELEFNSAVEVPESEEATVTFNFKALGSSGNDSLTLTQT